MIRCSRLPAPRAASQMATPATTRERQQHDRRDAAVSDRQEDRDREQRPELADGAERDDRDAERRPRSPESRSTGMIVPSAVDVRAMPMNAAAGMSAREE